MVTRNFEKVQEALDALNPVQSNINQLCYYKKNLNSPNHSNSLCSSVRSLIDILGQQHSEIVASLIYYGNSYTSTDLKWRHQNSLDYPARMGFGDDTGFTCVETAKHQKSCWEKFWNQIILGEFSDDVTWQGVTGNVIIGVVAGFFGLDAPMDVRDAAGNFSKGEWGWGIVDCIFLLPLVGMFKPAKYVKYADEIVDVAEPIIKHGDEFTNTGSTIIKQGTNALDKVDDLAITVNKIEPLAITGSKVQYKITGNVFERITKDGVYTSATNVGIISDFKYVKKSDELYTAARKSFNDVDRSRFIKHIAENNVDDLKKLGLTDVHIKSMLDTGDLGIFSGRFEIHHKLPLRDGGDNSFGNLILIDTDTHNIFTWYQATHNGSTALKNNGFQVIDWVIPKGNVYIGESAIESVSNVNAVKIPIIKDAGNLDINW